jgi:hypothetical protein
VENSFRQKQSFVLRDIAKLIKSNPTSIAKTLEKSGTFIENPYDKKELADKVAFNIANNKEFQQLIAIEIAKEIVEKQGFSNLGGKGKIDWSKQGQYAGETITKDTVQGASAGPWGALIGAVVGIIDSGFNLASAKKRALAEEEEYKAELYEELFDDKSKKKNKYLVPSLILGGVLIVGGVVTYFALKE